MPSFGQVTGTAFRGDINGLRAWAVVAVVLFHYKLQGFSGGFAGVDVFFVISGFLMTRMILASLASPNGFSFSEFFLARARRTVPALALLCAALMVMGWRIFPAVDYRQLSQHALAALAFVSNITFWREIDYFDTSTQAKWLLHTWSLSVEWQFYLVLPVALALLWRWRQSRRLVALALAIALAASLMLSTILAGHPGTAFYLLPTRAWELLAGGLVFICGADLALSPPQRRWLELLGLTLLCLTFGYFDSDVAWPSWRAMIPVAGTVMVLLAARPDSVWTGNRVAQFLGTISYSIYLWHWPLAVILRNLRLEEHPLALLAALTATIVLGYLSWTVVEQPARRMIQLRPAAGPAVMALMIAAVALPATYVLRHAGVPGRLPAYVDRVFAESGNRNPRYAQCYSIPGTLAECTYGGAKPGAIVIGDSHAQAIVRTVEKALPSSNLHVIDWSVSSCPTLLGVQSTIGRFPTFCGNYVGAKIAAQQSVPHDVPMIIMNRLSFYAFTLKNADGKEHPQPRIYFNTIYQEQSAAFKAEFREHIINTACAFAQTRPVFLVRPIPELTRNVPRTMGVALLLGRPERVSVSVAAYHERNQFVWDAQDAARQQCGAKILDPLPYLCDKDRCYGDRNGLPLYIDDNHLSERGARLLQPMFEQALH